MQDTATPRPRTARLVLVTPDGTIVGSLPAIPVTTPWWHDVEPVVRAIRQHYDIDVTVLRLLETELDRPHGGQVTYLAEVDQVVDAAPWHGTIDDHPHRHAFAKPGGPAADLAWAESVLANLGLTLSGRPTQIRTWNLSSLWRFPVEPHAVWLKVVPSFFAHEGDLLARLADKQVPRLLGHEGGRMLLGEIAGEDMYDAELPMLVGMINLLVGIQHSCAGRSSELLKLGLPDRRAPALSKSIADVMDRTADELSPEDRALLTGFVRDLPNRFAQVVDCGIGDTLVHGDFHPGNFRGSSAAMTLLDWGDSAIGHPLLDQPAFLDRVPGEFIAPVREHWLQRWREIVPGSDPGRAAALLGPIATARHAAVYRCFLDCIEPSEHPYHRFDPAEWLQRTASLVRQESV